MPKSTHRGAADFGTVLRRIGGIGRVAVVRPKYRSVRRGDVSNVPDDLLYNKSHEWIRVDGGEATIGITDHAQNALNDIVYVELPGHGDAFATEEEFGVVESVKSVSDLYLPVAGEITAVNEDLENTPELINEDPYGAGWLVKVAMNDPAEVAQLLSADDYRAEIGE